jgi:signal transduction histidine kinase
MLWKIIFSACTIYSIILTIYVFHKKDTILWNFISKHFRASEPALLNSIIDSIQEGIIVVDGRGNLIDHNNSASRFILYNFGQNSVLKGININSIFTMWPSWLMACNNMQSDDLEIDTTIFGTSKYYIIRVMPVFDRKHQKCGSVSIIIDITNRKVEEKERLRLATEHLDEQARDLKELNAYKDKLFVAFSHDIRNPMANMVSLITLLGEDEEYYRDDNREIFISVKDQVNLTYKSIENLLEWILSQKVNDEPIFFKLSEVVHDIIGIHEIEAESKKIRISSDIDDNIQIYAAKNTVEMVFRNILSNAIKFTDSGGVITIRLYETEEQNIIAVQDTGIGMNIQQIGSLFKERFNSTEVGTAGEKGLGIGLLMCNEFISRIGGRISVDSTLGVGTTFYISLPKHP